MKIAFIGQKGIPAIWGGVERHVEELAVRLARQGHQVTVYCRSWYAKDVNSVYRGVNLRFTPTWHTKNFDAIFHTLTATLDALRRDFDIIHYHGVGPALLSWIPRIFQPKTKVIVTFHCLDRLHGKWSWPAKLMLFLGESAACFFPHQTLVVSQTLKDYVMKKYHREAVYIPNGVNPSIDLFGEEKLKELSLKKNRYIIAVSRLIAHKATHNLIQAFKELKKEKPEFFSDVKLVIVGEGVQTDAYVNYLKTLAGNDPQVIFAGWQSGLALAELLANAKLFVHPSLSEGLPLVVLEAMSHGLPVVVSDIPEHLELITDRRFLFEHGNVEELKKTLVWAWQNPEICKVNGLLNKQKVEKEYNWNEIAEKTAAIYQKGVFCQGMPVFYAKRLNAKA